MARPPCRGDLWVAGLEPVVGNEQGGPPRPVLILSVDPLNHSPAGLSMAIPLSTTDRRIASHVAVEPPMGGLTRRSFVMCEQLRAISHIRLVRRLGSVEPRTMEEVERVVRRLLGFKG